MTFRQPRKFPPDATKFFTLICNDLIGADVVPRFNLLVFSECVYRSFNMRNAVGFLVSKNFLQDGMFRFISSDGLNIPYKYDHINVVVTMA